MTLKEFFESKSIEYAFNCDLKEMSTFKIGGKADVVCFPRTTRDVSLIVKHCINNNIKYIAIGRGSNVVFSDEGIKTLIIKTDKLDCIEHNHDTFIFGAGVMLAKASKYAVDNGYAGTEFAYGIPGSIGGAVYMNAGAYGGEMSQIVCSTEYVDEAGEIKTVIGDKHDFAYRHSFFSEKNFIITSVTLKLKKGDKTQSEQMIAEYQYARKSKQPLEFPSAGSVFKRPEGYFAGKLIQDCNFKGYTVGGAQVSEKHSGFIINIGDATCADVKALIEQIKQKVYDAFGVKLECELKFIID